MIEIASSPDSIAADVRTLIRAEEELDLRLASSTSVVRAIAREGHYETRVIDVIDTLCSASSRTLFIDVGSNIGYITLSLLARARRRGVPGPAVVAYEPSSDSRETAGRLMEANQLHYVLRPEALSDHSGTATLYLSARSDSSHSVLSDFRPSRGTELVTLSTVDAELEKLWDDVKPHLLVLKIDVEGAEAMVLAGAHRTLAERRPVLVFEVLPGRGETEIATVLEEHAYTLFRPSSSRWVESRTLFGDESYRDRDWVALPSEMAAMANCFLAETDPDSLSPRFVSRRNREADRALSIWVETVLARSNDASRDLATARVQIEEQALELVSQRLATEDMSARVLAAELNLEQEVESLGGICADLRLQVSSLQQQRLEVEEALRRRDEEVRRTELQLQEAIEMNSLHVSMLTQVFRSRSWRWTRWLRRHSRHGWSEQSSTRRGIEQGGQ